MRPLCSSWEKNHLIMQCCKHDYLLVKVANETCFLPRKHIFAVRVNVDYYTHTYGTMFHLRMNQPCVMQYRGIISLFLFTQQTEPETFLRQAVHHLSSVLREFILRQAVHVCKLITDQIFVKGNCVLRPFPFDGKSEPSAMNAELWNGKWVSYLFQTVDLSWVKWKSFMLVERKRPEEEEPAICKFQSGLYIYFLFQSCFLKLESHWGAKQIFSFEAISVKKKKKD